MNESHLILKFHRRAPHETTYGDAKTDVSGNQINFYWICSGEQLAQIIMFPQT